MSQRGVDLRSRMRLEYTEAGEVSPAKEIARPWCRAARTPVRQEAHGNPLDEPREFIPACPWCSIALPGR